jgi:hypothetical protein
MLTVSTIILLFLAVYAISLAVVLYARIIARRIKVPGSKNIAPSMFNVAVKIQNSDEKSESTDDNIIVQIAGPFEFQIPQNPLEARITAEDITEPESAPAAVLSNDKRTQLKKTGSLFVPVFLGRITAERAASSQWITIARIALGTIRPPRKGFRRLCFSVKIHSANQSRLLASATAAIDIDFDEDGYIDTEEIVQQNRSRAVTLALNIARQAGRITHSKRAVILTWAKKWLKETSGGLKDLIRLYIAFYKAVMWFRGRHTIDTAKIASDITRTTPLQYRLDIISLCMDVLAISKEPAEDALRELKITAQNLKPGDERLREMIFMTLPLSMWTDFDDEGFIFGIKPEMDMREKTAILTDEYRKWNSRTTNKDHEIQNQANVMLRLISAYRQQFRKG